MCKDGHKLDMRVKKNGFMVTLWDMNFDFSKVFDDARYAVFGNETCPETGRPHKQGFVYWNREKTGNATIKYFNNETHLCHAVTIDEAIKYCKKCNDFVESGRPPKQGKRTDILEVRNHVVSGGNIDQAIDKGFGYQALRHAELVLKYKEPKRNWKPNVIWYYGESGVGKTRRVMEALDGKDHWMSNKSLKWWEGYDGHENVVIEEFRSHFCEFSELLRILDRYEYRVEVKGGSRQLRAKNIWITSCFHPKDVYVTDENIKQLIRRIDVIEKIV